MIEKARRAIEAMSNALDVFDKMELPIEERECTLSYEAATAIIQGFRQLEHEIKSAKKSLAKDHEDIMTIVNGFRQLESERDAAVEALSRYKKCIDCKYWPIIIETYGFCNGCESGSNWQWRGAQEET